MKIFANFALIFGTLGFIGLLLTILIGFLGCCIGISQLLFHNLVLVALVSGIVLFGICMYNNCSRIRNSKENG